MYAFSRQGIRANFMIVNDALSRLARQSAETAVKTDSAVRMSRSSAETAVKTDSLSRLARQSAEVVLTPDSYARVARQSMEVAVRGSTGFVEPFDRSDRELVGDNGWYATHTLPSTGIYTVTSNRFRTVVNTSGFPGSSGTIGDPIAHAVTPYNSDIEDVSFDIITGAIDTSPGYLWFVMAATTTGSPATIDTGAILAWQLNNAADWASFGLITATNSTTNHFPSFPACPPNATTHVRMQLTRSTGVLKCWVDGTLRYTSTAGHFSGLTGSLVAIQLQKSYANAPIEIDNLVVS